MESGCRTATLEEAGPVGSSCTGPRERGPGLGWGEAGDQTESEDTHARVVSPARVELDVFAVQFSNIYTGGHSRPQPIPSSGAAEKCPLCPAHVALLVLAKVSPSHGCCAVPTHWASAFASQLPLCGSEDTSTSSRMPGELPRGSSERWCQTNQSKLPDGNCSHPDGP